MKEVIIGYEQCHININHDNTKQNNNPLCASFNIIIIQEIIKNAIKISKPLINANGYLRNI